MFTYFWITIRVPNMFFFGRIGHIFIDTAVWRMNEGIAWDKIQSMKGCEYIFPVPGEVHRSSIAMARVILDG